MQQDFFNKKMYCLFKFIEFCVIHIMENDHISSMIFNLTKFDHIKHSFEFLITENAHLSKLISKLNYHVYSFLSTTIK